MLVQNIRAVDVIVPNESANPMERVVAEVVIKLIETMIIMLRATIILVTQVVSAMITMVRAIDTMLMKLDMNTIMEPMNIDEDLR